MWALEWQTDRMLHSLQKEGILLGRKRTAYNYSFQLCRRWYPIGQILFQAELLEKKGHTFSYIIISNLSFCSRNVLKYMTLKTLNQLRLHLTNENNRVKQIMHFMHNIHLYLHTVSLYFSLLLHYI